MILASPVGALAAAAVVSVLLVAVSPIPAAADAPVLDVQGMTFVASRGDVNELVLHAESARFETGRQTAHLSTVRVNVAESNDRDGFRMTCDRGDLDLASNDFYAEGNVLGRTDGGREFSAPWVRYAHAEGLLFTDAPVIITEDSGTSFRGGGFRYYVRERRFRIMGGATVLQEDR